MYIFIIFLLKMNFAVCFLSPRMPFTIQVLSYDCLLLFTVINVSVGIFMTINACNALPTAEFRLEQMLKDVTQI